MRGSHRHAWAIGAALLLAVLASGCGSSEQKHEAQALEKTSILSKTAPLGERLVRQGEIAAATDKNAERTFLQLWSLLQFEAWSQAEQLFEPGLRAAIGPALLAESLENDIIVWQATKPRIVSARVAGGTATVSFLARNEAGDVLPTSIAFGGGPGTWRVSYFALLNPAIARTAEQREQARIEPLGTKPNPEAVRRADSAAIIQQRYLEHRLASEPAPAKP